MENLTYNLYRANPEFRQQLEAEAREMQREAMRQYLVLPVVRMWSRLVAPRGKSFGQNLQRSV